MKTSLKRLFLLCCTTLAIMSLSAQTSTFQFGIKGGLNLSTALVNDASSIKIKPGYHIGGTIEHLITPKFALQSGLLFSVKGSEIDGFDRGSYDGGTPDFTHTFNAFYFELPLYAVLKRNISDNLKINIGFGPYFAYGIGGKTKEG